jgi:soluble lytic murein transglycosylase-like protein
MLIVDCKGVSVNMSTPADAVPYWLDSGTTIRALATVPSSADLAASRSIMPLVASAPEFAVADADRADAAAADAAAKAAAITAAQSAVAQRNKALASRSASYQFRSEPLPGDAHPIAPLSAKLLAVYAPYRQFVAQNAPNLSPKMVDTITTSILYYSDQEKLDPRLVIAMILAESNFDPLSTSRTGAMGLSQLMPSTAAGLGVSNAYDPVQNIGAAVHILSGHVKQYGGADANGLVPINTLLLTMAAYNAGPGAVKRYGGVPPYAETQHYVRKVAALYRRMCGI